MNCLLLALVLDYLIRNVSNLWFIALYFSTVFKATTLHTVYQEFFAPRESLRQEYKFCVCQNNIHPVQTFHLLNCTAQISHFVTS